MKETETKTKEKEFTQSEGIDFFVIDIGLLVPQQQTKGDVTQPPPGLAPAPTTSVSQVPSSPPASGCFFHFLFSFLIRKPC